MIKIAHKIPDLELDVYHQNEIRTIRLADYAGKWLVIVFYPADFTFVCPTEREDLAELSPQFHAEGAKVLSVSTDTVSVRKAWHDYSPAIRKICFPMVAGGVLSREFGVYIEKEGVALRGSFVVDPDGVLRAYEVHDNSIGRSMNELLRKLQAAKFVREHGEEVCPANWQPGTQTLKPSLDLVGKI